MLARLAASRRFVALLAGTVIAHEGCADMFKHLALTLFGALVVAALAAPANAQDDIAQKVQVCAACHGENGVPADPKTTPIIWGQQSSYLYKELHDYHSGDRKSPIMAPVVKDLSLQDLRKIADYFAAKSWPPGHPAAAAVPAPEGIAQCRSCHQPNFEGGEPAPRLAGLSSEYLVAAMRAFADGTRTNNLDMPGFMKAHTEGDREAMARYIAGL
jgi:cytochrome c553